MALRDGEQRYGVYEKTHEITIPIPPYEHRYGKTAARLR